LKSRKFKWIALLPALMAAFAVVIDRIVPPSSRAMNIDTPYFSYVMAAVTVVFAICAVITVFNKDYRIKYLPKVKFYTVLILFINLLNFLTDKTTLLKGIYFPPLNNVLAVAVTEREMLINCVLYSGRLLILGIIFGGAAGILTGVIIGWYKEANYWIFPVFRFIGPMPTAIWIPIALLVFPTLLSASVFIVALSMWFPTMVQTSSGIQNVSKGYYDVARTMGASTLYQIINIAIPAALPQIFVGLFSGVTTSFITLMMAELMGSKYGIGWYINWQQQIMSYSNVWMAFLILAVCCFLVLKGLFALRKKFLSWQEGIIRW
jgi:NitT/TauT family transport system permease protein